jgi:hypothetical protein
MKYIYLVLFGCLLSTGSSLRAEDIGTFKIEARETKTFTYKSVVGQVFAFKVLQGPELPTGQNGFEFGWEKQGVFCEGKNCARAGGYLLFCPKAGVITGNMKNLSQQSFDISVQRVECEGKEAGTMRCPRSSTLKAMCG